MSIYTKSICSILITTLCISPLKAQEETKETKETGPYKLCLKADIPITIIGIAGTAYGFTLREGKSDLDSNYVKSLNVMDLPKHNRNVTTQNSLTASQVSDFLLAGGFVFPWFLALDKPIRRDIGTVSLMYLETMAITGMGYWLTAGLTDKLRPYVYNKEVDMKKRTSKHSKNSFYGGHPSVTAAGTFFIAQVYDDYHPDSKFKYVLWGFAGTATLANAYARYKGGFHFATDIAIGVSAGTAIGILVPILHRKKDKDKESKLTLAPYFGDYNGVSLTYKFKDSKQINYDTGL